MAAPTNAAKREKALANSEPSTHGTFRTRRSSRCMSVFGATADDIYSERVFRLLTRFGNELAAPCRPITTLSDRPGLLLESGGLRHVADLGVAVHLTADDSVIATPPS
jgi:hypothetical protein